MPHYRLFLAFILFIFNLLPHKNFACGYSFIGECSTGIHLRINNTLDSFNVAECSYGKTFAGLDLGNIQSLNLAKATSITWESCDNNVSGVALYYRVKRQGMPSGSWSIFNLQEDYNTLVGPYTARYRSQYSNANLTAGLTQGKTYTLEIYFLAQVDTVGNDFIPETTMIQNNNGQNYKLTFKFGGVSAPPFTVVNTQLDNEKCPGDSTGVVGVTVYGNQSNLFYQWSNVNNNFNTLYELTAGTYTVTVSGVNGYTQTQTMTVIDPEPISITFANIQNVVCGNTPGSASASASGGMAPYSYFWETGDPDSTSSIPLPGLWGLSVTDANGCVATASVQVGGSSTLQQTLNKTICQGTAFQLGNQSFTVPGNYQVLVSGNGSCDTLFSLTLSVLNPGAALNNIPATASLTCNSPTLSLCAASLPSATYEWRRANVIVASSPCLTINNSAPYTLIVSLQSCMASQTVLVESHLTAPLVQVTGNAVYLDCTSSLATIVLVAETDAIAPAFVWTQNGNIISTADSAVVSVSNPLDFIPPSLLVTDAYGCQATAGNVNIIIHPHPEAPSATSTATPASGETVADGSIQLTISGGTPGYTTIWNNGSTTPDIDGLLPGEYCYTVTDATGCVAVGCTEVDFTNAVVESELSAFQLFPNPVKSGGMLQIELSGLAANGSCNLQLFNLQGKNVLQENRNAGLGSIYVKLPDALPAGQYFLRLTSENTGFVRRLIVY